MNKMTPFDVLIVEDNIHIAQLHLDAIKAHPRLHCIGVAQSLDEAIDLFIAKKPNLILLDNYLPDGQGITLVSHPLISESKSSIIFITAASDMDTCSQAIRNGAFDYILKPISPKRLRQSLESYVQFEHKQQEYKLVDQKNIDMLLSLQGRSFEMSNKVSKGIEEKTLALIQAHFDAAPEKMFSIDDMVTLTSLSKTTARRYLEYSVSQGTLDVEMQYGQVGHPRRLYRLNKT